MNERCLLIFAPLSLALAVVTGAFGAHGLKALVSPAQLAVWQTAVLYHLIHGLGLLGIATLAPQMGGFTGRAPCSRLLRLAAWCLLLGLVVFSGSLYLLVLVDAPWLGAVTPVGGMALIVGWLSLALAGVRRPARETNA